MNYNIEPIFSIYFPGDDMGSRFIYPEIKPLILTISLGLTSFSIGYFLLNYFGLKKINYFKIDWNYKIEHFLILIFFLFIPFYYINNEKNFINLSILTQLKFPIIIFLLSYFQIKYLISKNIYFSIVVVLLLSLLFVIEISSGSTVFPYLLVVIVVATNFFKNKRINFLTILIIVSSMILAHSFKYEIRAKTWDYENKNQYSDNNKSQLLKKLNQTKEVYLKTDLDKIFNSQHTQGQLFRLFHSNTSLQVAQTRTPEEIEFYGGKSYRGIIYKFIPRFLFKDKPQEEWGNFWGKRYEIINLNDYHTAWNFPVLNEFYSNYANKGVVIGMFLLGFVIKLILFFLNFNFNQPVLFSMVSTVVLNFFFLESNLSLVLGSVINQLLFFSTIIILMCSVNFLLKKVKNSKIKI
ncbi:hypothetical protein [Candidatus Pelagibacter sp.]|uniref:hypothetical protein n=1 Tax=Candidatus Pelagibacter sp. TaxID=2024849 RepID=UPI003F844A71